MAEVRPPELTPAQVAVLEKLLHAGFKFVSLERFARYPAVEREGFVALLDTAAGKVRIFGQAGYRMGEGIGMLMERETEKAFVWHGESVEATPELLAAYNKFKTELNALLESGSRRQ
jgi:hypothetical protein